MRTGHIMGHPQWCRQPSTTMTEASTKHVSASSALTRASVADDHHEIPRLTVGEMGSLTQTIRRHIVRMTAAAGSGHPGGSLSSVEILTSLYFKVLRHDPRDPDWPGRDRFILSKGHCTPVLYSTLAEAGLFPRGGVGNLPAGGQSATWPLPQHYAGSRAVFGVLGARTVCRGGDSVGGAAGQQPAQRLRATGGWGM